MTDKLTVNLVVIFLGVIAVSAMVIAGLLILNDKSIPDMFVAMGSGALGGLAGILARTSTGGDQVIVANEPDQPVPVDAAGD